MQYRELAPPASHPHVVRLQIDPFDWQRLERLIDQSRELRLLSVDDRQPDAWTVIVGCASARVAEALEDGWM